MAAESPLSQLSSTTVATIIALCGELDTPFTLTVCGQSMAPMLRDGDKVLLHPPRRPLRRGDIVVRKCGDEILMHRVVGLRRIGDETWMTTKGDNSLTFDEPVLASEILGLVVEIMVPSLLDLRRGPWPTLGLLLAGYSAIHGRCWRATRPAGWTTASRDQARIRSPGISAAELARQPRRGLWPGRRPVSASQMVAKRLMRQRFR